MERESRNDCIVGQRFVMVFNAYLDGVTERVKLGLRRKGMSFSEEGRYLNCVASRKNVKEGV